MTTEEHWVAINAALLQLRASINAAAKDDILFSMTFKQIETDGRRVSPVDIEWTMVKDVDQIGGSPAREI